MTAYHRMQPWDVLPTIISLQERLETLRQGEIARVRGRLGRLSPEQENALESLTRGIINKILHGPMTVLKAASAEKESAFFIDIVHRIFKLGERRKREGRTKTAALKVGQLELSMPAMVEEIRHTVMLHDRTRVTDGIELSDDPVLAARCGV